MTPLGVDALQHGDCALGVVHELSPEGIRTLRRRDIYFVTCKPTARILRVISVLGCALPADRRQEHLADGTPIGPIEPKRRGGIGGGKHDARARVVHRRRLLSKRPDARFATAAEVLTALHDGARPIEVAQLALSSSQSPSAPPVRPASLPSLLSVVNSVIADPSVALRIMTPARWAAAAVVAMILFMMSLWVLGSWAPKSSGQLSSETPLASGATSHLTATASHAATTLPSLPAAPSSTTKGRAASTAAPSTSTGQKSDGHRTGPGGIYVPPPSQWFN